MMTEEHPIIAENIARRVKIIEKEKTINELAEERGVNTF
jgi:hypothetical protein